MFTRKIYEWGLAVKKFTQDLKNGLVKNTGRMIKPAQLENHDIPTIVYGKLGYVLKKIPREYCFTFSKIFRSWLNIGFVSFTRHTLLH